MKGKYGNSSCARIMVVFLFGALVLGALGAGIASSGGTSPQLLVSASINPPVVESANPATISVKVTDGTSPIENAEVAFSLDNESTALGGKIDPAVGHTAASGELGVTFFAPQTRDNRTSTIIIMAGKMGYMKGDAGLTVTILGNGSAIPPHEDFYIKVEPAFVTMMVGEVQAFEAHGWWIDSNGTANPVDEPIDWGLVSAIGKLAVDPVNDHVAKFAASLVGYTQVTAAMSHLGKTAKGSAEVNVCNSGSGNHTMKLMITPVKATLSSGGTQVFESQAYDDCMNPITAGVEYRWSVTGGIGQVIPELGRETIFTAAIKGYGQVVVTATHEGLSASASAEVTVLPEGGNATFLLVITPERAELPVGGTQGFTAQAYDSLKNPIPGLKYSWDAVGGIGKLDPLEGEKTNFVATAPGYGQVMVKAEYSGVYAKATAEVQVGEHKDEGCKVVVTPEKATLKVGAAQKFTAQAYEADGTPIMGLTYRWEVAGSKMGEGGKGMPDPVLSIGKIDETGLFTAINPGYGQVVAGFKDSSGKTGMGFASVMVEPIEGADLGVFSMGFSSKMPVPGETVIVYALIFNFGTEAARGTVTFYDENTTVGSPQSVYVIPGFTDIAFVDWAAVNGSHKFRVEITGVDPVDGNLHNNEAFAELMVGKSVTPPDIKLDYSITVSEKDGKYIIDIELVLVCGKNPVHAIHIVIWDTGGLSIDLGVSSSFDMKPGDTMKLYLKITVKKTESIDRDITVQAVGNETSSGVATIPVQVGAPPTGTGGSLWTAQNLALILFGAGAGVGAAAAVFFRRRHRNRSP